MSKITIVCEYSAFTKDEIDLPNGLGYEDLDQWDVQNGTFSYTLKGERKVNILALSDIDQQALDRKVPRAIMVVGRDEDGEFSQTYFRDED